MALSIYGADAEEVVVFGHAACGEGGVVADEARVCPDRGGRVAPDNFVAREVWLCVRCPAQFRVVGQICSRCRTQGRATLCLQHLIQVIREIVVK